MHYEDWLQKAFDYVHWDFLKDLLHHLKFPFQFVTWVMVYITSVTYRVYVNGMQGEAFEGGWGLKQGDPLSPLLFVLAMKYFTRLMTVAGEQPLFIFHPSCKQFKLNHLIFADDAIIFSKAHLPTLQIVQSTLEMFYKVARLRANLEKSPIVCEGCNSQLQQQCLELIGYNDGCLPMRYLGVPITVSKLRKLKCHILVDKIIGKMKQWSIRNLSFAGRAQLINTVVFGMYGFWGSIFILPQEVINKVNQLCKNFLWGGLQTIKGPLQSHGTLFVPLRNMEGFTLKIWLHGTRHVLQS